MSLTLVIMQRIQTVVNVKAAVIILPKISGEIVVPKSFLIIHDPHNNINNPGKWLRSNMCFYRQDVLVFYYI
jgi:hypothetical protein